MSSGSVSNALVVPAISNAVAKSICSNPAVRASNDAGVLRRRTADLQSSWYVAQVLSRKEGYAAGHLERQGFETLFPRFYQTRSHSRKTETVLASLFPGYIFVKFNIKLDRWLSINSTRGVIRLVGPRMSTPQPVPAQVIEVLKARCRAGVLTKLPDDIKRGDRLQINAGPLAGQIATIESLNDQRRVSVLLTLMGSEHSVLVNADQLSPIVAL